MQVEVVATDDVGARAAAYVADALGRGVVARGRATVAFSGGSSSRGLLEALVDQDVAWSSVHVVQVDERVAPAGHEERNLSAIESLLLDRVDIPPSHIHPMPVDEPDLEQAAAQYTSALAGVAGTPPTLDVVHLGIGADGHTASLLPGSNLIRADAAPVATTAVYQGRRRMTLTAPVLSLARHVLWLVTGSAKAEVIRRFVDGDVALPAVHVERSRSLLLLDPPAAAGLPGPTRPRPRP